MSQGMGGPGLYISQQINSNCTEGLTFHSIPWPRQPNPQEDRAGRGSEHESRAIPMECHQEFWQGVGEQTSPPARMLICHSPDAGQSGENEKQTTWITWSARTSQLSGQNLDKGTHSCCKIDGHEGVTSNEKVIQSQNVAEIIENMAEPSHQPT